MVLYYYLYHKITTLASNLIILFIMIQYIYKSFRIARQYWLGGSDWTTEGAWVWEPYGQSINYTNWLHGQPDNSHNAEHCLMVDRHFHFKWLDSDCHTALHYICEDP